MATLTYAVGGVTLPVIESSPTGNSTAGVGNGTASTFLVDYKVNLLVAGSGALVNVTPGQVAATNVVLTGAYTTFTVTNLSNTPQDFALTAADAATGTAFVAPATSNDAFDSTGVTIYVGAALNTAVVATKITALAAGSSTNVYVVSAIPVAATNGQQDMISLQAQAIWPAALPVWAPAATANGNTLAVAGAAIVATTAGTVNNAGTTVDIVFADTAGVLDAARDGKSSAYNGYVIASAAISVKKQVAVLCDPVNGATNPKNIPGAAVQYAITITNTGSGPATLTQISDALSASTAWDAGLISGAGVGTACVAGAATTLSATGFGALSGVGATTYAAPGAAGQAVTAGATVAGAVGAQTATITFSGGTNLASPTYSLVGGVLPSGSFVTVYFNSFVQ